MGLSRDFGGHFVYVFFYPIRNDPKRKKHINKILAPTQSRDNPANLFYVCVFFAFPDNHIHPETGANIRLHVRDCGPRLNSGPKSWKTAKEYLNQRGTKIRVFRVRFRGFLRKTLQRKKDLQQQFLRDLSPAVGRTQRDSPEPFPQPSFPCGQGPKACKPLCASRLSYPYSLSYAWPSDHLDQLQNRKTSKLRKLEK